ncbi:hypothetical protein JR316_0004855 [Psilocybe cubensis]|uniref:Uncharacterized protein n=2 Tax=Psilocybe cubensis TaxID=181762 RepID=A0ACB8H428_PSICU|nr:hypothetical protein JR316_0004855 [Psilocybe cubensis]KAH9482755.1 hypothetical protein JR316_0004855 [Psilocybe cubensis]
MNGELLDDDSVDTAALQAQIDMSMSFAQSLVTSWMDPHKFPKSSRRQHLEQEITEYMKRPPRLGVGAAIPEGMQSQTREVARLKGKLTSKRPREEVDAVPSSVASDDEDESKVIAVKKKARFDPFDVVHGKKKKKKISDTASVKLEAPVSPPASPTKAYTSENTGDDHRPGDSDKVVTSPKSKKKRSKSLNPMDIVDDTKQTTPPANSETLPPSLHEDAKNLAHEALAAQSPSKSSRKTLPLDLLKIPLLNLDGPPSDPENDHEPVTPSTPTKKKRKRRKKNKNHPTVDALETQASTSQATPI